MDIPVSAVHGYTVTTTMHILGFLYKHFKKQTKQKIEGHLLGNTFNISFEEQGFWVLTTWENRNKQLATQVAA